MVDKASAAAWEPPLAKLYVHLTQLPRRRYLYGDFVVESPIYTMSAAAAAAHKDREFLAVIGDEVCLSSFARPTPPSLDAWIVG